MTSTITRPNHGRPALAPRRKGGHDRVDALLAAAAAVIAERGYGGATMAEVAARAGARIGSLYRFFPNKDVLAEALMARYQALAAAAWDGGEARAPGMAADELADFLLDFLVAIHGETQAMNALLASRHDGSGRWQAIRTWALERIARVLLARSPGLGGAAARDAAVIVLENMKLMATMTFSAPGNVGALAALRTMNRLYVRHLVGE